MDHCFYKQVMTSKIPAEFTQVTFLHIFTQVMSKKRTGRRFLASRRKRRRQFYFIYHLYQTSATQLKSKYKIPLTTNTKLILEGKKLKHVLTLD